MNVNVTLAFRGVSEENIQINFLFKVFQDTELKIVSGIGKEAVATRVLNPLYKFRMCN